MNAAQAKAIAAYINRATTDLDGAALAADGAAYTITTRNTRVSFTLADPSDGYAVQVKHPTAGGCFGWWDRAEWQPLATWPAESLAYVARAMGENDIRQYLNGMAIYQGVGIGASDGHRLHYIGDVSSESPAIVPRDAVALALRLQKKGPVSIDVAGDLFRLRLDSGAEIAGRLIDATYPALSRVIPAIDWGDYRATPVPAHPARDIRKARDMVRTVSPKYRGMVLLDAGAYTDQGDRLPLNIHLPDGGEMGINADYLAEAIETGEESLLHFRDKNSAILIESGGRRAVVMPMRLDSFAGIREKIAEKSPASTPAAPISAPAAVRQAGPGAVAIVIDPAKAGEEPQAAEEAATAPTRDVADFRVGDLVRVSDGTPKPPAHHKKKLASWHARNYDAVVSDLDYLPNRWARVGVHLVGRPYMVYMLDPTHTDIYITTPAPRGDDATEAKESEQRRVTANNSAPKEPPRMAAMADGTRPRDAVAVEWLDQGEQGQDAAETSPGQPAGPESPDAPPVVYDTDATQAAGGTAETSAPQPAPEDADPAETSEGQPAVAIQWPEGVTVSAHLSTPAKVAAIIRKELAAIGIPCRVKSSRFSMGNSVTVDIENVPPEYVREIRAHFAQYQYGSFDGMTDCYEYTNSRDDIPQTKYLTINNTYTQEAESAAWQWFRDNFHPEGIEDVPADIASREFQHARIWQDYAPTILWRVLSGTIDRDGRTFWDDYPGGNRPTPPRGGKPAPKPAQARTPTPAPVPGIAAHVEAHHNTRKGFDYWLVVLADRVDRDTFADLLASAKASGGWYSRQWGDIPGGFAFKAQAAAEDFAASLNGGPSAPPPGQKPGAETSQPQPAQPAPASHPQPAPAGDPARAAKLRALAQGLQPAIDKAFAPRLDNTPKRAAQAAHARLEGHRLERTQKALNALADLAEAGTTPAPLAGITSKAAVYELMAATTEQVANGWHSYRIDTGKPAIDTEPARLLWALLDDNGERHQQAELARKLAAVKLAGIPGYFPTPEPVAAEILQHLDIAPGCVVLEPSAGSGSLCDAIKARQPDAQVLAYEVNHALRDILAAKGHTPAGGDFTEQPAAPVADFVVMNPPFEQLQDAEHVRHAFGFLKPGGRLVAIMSPAPFTNSTRKAQAFREWFAEVGGTRYDLPAGAFKESGTGVATCYVIIDAPKSVATSPTPPAVATSDTQPVQDSNAKAMKVYNWDAVALSNAYTNDQLVALMRQVEAQHRNPVDAQGHPLENGRSTLHLFDKAGRRKLDAIGWAITYNLAEQKEAQAPTGATLH